MLEGSIVFLISSRTLFLVSKRSPLLEIIFLQLMPTNKQSARYLDLCVPSIQLESLFVRTYLINSCRACDNVMINS